MWRIWNWLFGWDYVAVGYGNIHFIRRVRKLPDGTPYIRVLDTIERLQKDGRTNYQNEYIPMTWNAEAMAPKFTRP